MPFPLSEPSYAAPVPGDTATKSRASAERAKAVTSRERIMTGEVGKADQLGWSGCSPGRVGHDDNTPHITAVELFEFYFVASGCTL